MINGKKVRTVIRHNKYRLILDFEMHIHLSLGFYQLEDYIIMVPLLVF